MMKGQFSYKVKIVPDVSSRMKFLVYRASRVPVEICWTYSRTRAYEIARMLNEANNQRFKLE